MKRGTSFGCIMMHHAKVVEGRKVILFRQKLEEFWTAEIIGRELMAEGLRKAFLTDCNGLALECLGNPCQSWVAGEF